MASLFSSLLRCSSSRISLSFSLSLSRHLSPPLPPLPTTSHLFSTSPSPPLNPTQLYLFLSSSSSSSSSPTNNPNLSKSQWDKLTIFFRSFSKSPWAIDQALSLYLPSSSLPSAASKFRLFFLSNNSPQTAVQLLEMAESESELAVHRFLFPVFADSFLKELQGDLKKFKQLKDTDDLTKPYTWHPFARAMKRKVRSSH